MKWMRWMFPAAAVAAMSLAPNVFAQAATAPPASAATQPTTDAQNTNIQAYIELLRSNVQTAKTEVLTETMQLNGCAIHEILADLSRVQREAAGPE